MSVELPVADATKTAGVLRRLGAMLYDTMIVIGVLIVATIPFVPFLHGKVLVPREVGALAYVYWLWECVVVVVFFGYFWTRRGQTIGMLAWRLRMERRDGGRVTWSDAIKRMLVLAALLLPLLIGYHFVWHGWSDATARTIANSVALLPLVFAYAWIWVDRDGLAWHDRWTGTRLIVLPKRQH